MLYYGFWLIEFKGEEAKPVSDVGLTVKIVTVGFNDFSHRCNSVISAVAITIFLFTSFLNFTGLNQSIEPCLYNIGHISRCILSIDS